MKYVDKNIQVFEGSEAEARLKNDNDSAYCTDEGIIQVPRGRWKEAQEYEHKTWMIDGLSAKHDHNETNLSQLDFLHCLRGRTFNDVIELGSGPFTNVAVFPKEITLRNVTVLDPLMDEYIKHPNNRVRSFNRINSTIEDFEPKHKYDLIVMINVLEHCFDIPKVFEKIMQMSWHGTTIVFGDIMFDAAILKNMSRTTYNAGHPIRVSKQYLDKVMKDNISDTLFLKIYETVCAGYQAYETYFIGEIK